ncbi:MAG: tetratricopeptide repeat protein [Magnetococcales bacterium]|nr:tetratricopeptide repeat protein [Magnetococcales bacterium]
MIHSGTVLARQLLAQGSLCQAQGQFRDAKICYQKALAQQQHFAEAYCNLGVLAIIQDRLAEAEGYLRQAIHADINHAEAHYNLAVVLSKQKLLAQAVTHYEYAWRLRPDNVAMGHQLVASLMQLGDLYHRQQRRGPTSEPLYRRVLTLQPDHAEAQVRLSILLIGQWQLEQAMACSRNLLDLTDVPVDQLLQKTSGYLQQNRTNEAIVCLVKLILVYPQQGSLCNQLGVLIKGKGYYDEAIVCYQQAIRIEPKPLAYSNLGIAFYDTGCYQEAEAALQQALALESNSFNTLRSLAAAYDAQNKLVEAADCYKKAAAINDDVYCKYFYDLTLLLILNTEGRSAETRGKWLSLVCDTAHTQVVFRDNGLSDKIVSSIQGLLSHPVDWQGKHVLITTDLEAFGDAIQGMRYIPYLAHLGARITVSAVPARASLFQAMTGVERVIRIEENRSLTSVDYCIPLGALGSILEIAYGCTLENRPYLRPDPDKVEKWHRILGFDHRPDTLKVGLVWGVGTRPPFDRGRAIAHVEKLWPLFDIPGIDWISLQMGEWTDLMERFPPGKVRDLRLNDPDIHQDSMDSAAILHHLDLYVSVDTGLPHLAGAIGCPVWLLFALVPDHRWPRDCDNGDISPFYSTTRLFRQRRLGDWDELIARVATTLVAERETLLANRKVRQAALSLT